VDSTTADPSRAPGPSEIEGLADDGAGAVALDRVLREGEYRQRLSKQIHDLLRLGVLMQRGVRGEVSRPFCLRLAEEAERVEADLLEVGARGNRAHAFLAEAVAGTRWGARAVHSLLHLRGRIRRYLGDRADLETFRSDLDACVRWLVARLAALLGAIRDEARSLSLDVPTEPFDPGLLRGEEARWRLPQDIAATDGVAEGERVVEIATAFVAIADELATVPSPPEGAPALREFARAGWPAPRAEQVQVRIHAIQSAYDCSVAGTPLEGSDPSLKVLRGYVSILLHLVESVSYLLQWEARIEGEARAPALKARLEPLADPGGLRRWALAFGLVNTKLGFAEAKTAAQGVLDRYARARDVVLDLPPGRRLHLRPAGLIVRVALHHGLSVQMGMGDQEVDARQLMDVILLAASHPNETRVRFRGADKPLADLTALFHARLGEEGFGELPPSLAYLKEPIRPPAR
jgi:phosphotransferase system HPr (HPr) family protein